MKSLLSSLFFAFGLSVCAQTADPVLMNINGKPITRGEFEYSYNKNGNIEGAVEKKTVEEYVDMFINYKLKVAAAEEARFDTLASFRKEFRQYRDMQLTPYMVDTVFIDSVARSMYQRTADQLKGQDMLRLAHILLFVRQDATDEQKQAARSKIDSLYTALQGGADFSELAKRYSQDPGSASRGGELPWIGPDMTLKEFETAAYLLKKDEISQPVETSVGYHIIKMLERKQLESYDEIRKDIVTSLKRQGIEEESAEKHIRKIVETSGGRLTRENVMDSLLNAHLADAPDLKHLVTEYHDGLLLYEMSKNKVWDVAANDSVTLEKMFKADKKKYAWKEPRFKGFVFHCKSPKQVKAVASLLKKKQNGDWRKAVREAFNKDSVTVRVSGPYLSKKGENPYIDQYVFKSGEAKAKANFPYSGVAGKKLSKPQTYLDVKSMVQNDYQEQLEKAWIEELRAKYPVEVNREVLKTVNNH